MNTLWVKVRIWAKLIFFALLIFYLLLFVGYNSGASIRVWLFWGTVPEPSLLVVLFITFLLGVVMTLLVRMVSKTIRQMREYRDRTRTLRLEREMADMKAKADMLKLKTSEGEKPVE